MQLRNGILSTYKGIEDSGSVTITGSLSVSDSITGSAALFTGTITAQTLVVQVITSSISYITGSTRFGSLLTDTHAFTGSVNISSSLTVVGALNATASNAISASYTEYAVSSSYPIAATGSTLYSVNPLVAPPKGSSTNRSIFLGDGSGYKSDFADYSIFLGPYAGAYAYSASISVFIGSTAGIDAINVASSVFIGQAAGDSAGRASYSNFIGEAAGQRATSASYSNFIGYNAGYRAKFASHSILIGNWAGSTTSNVNSIGPNNIIIGNNISFVDDRRDSVNIGAIIFATGSYNQGMIGSDPFKGTSNGRVGINQINPTTSLDVSGSGRFTSGLTVTQSVQISQDVTSSAQLTARNFGGDTYSWIRNNTTTGQAILRTEARAGTYFDFGRRGESLSTYKIIAADDAFIMNSGFNSQHMSILNDNAVGIIKIAAGGASSPHITIHQTGLVAISSSLEVSSSLNVSRSITGSSALINGKVTASAFVKSGGTSTEFLKADGTVDTNTYITAASIGDGTLSLGVSGTGLSGTETFTANQSGNSTFTVTSNATSANTANTIVSRDASGNFSAGTMNATASQATALENTGSAGFVSNMSDTYTGTAKIRDIVTLSAAEYAAIGAPSTSTLYVVI